MERRTLNFGSFLRGLMVGSILASVVVLFTAPQSGLETRQMLRDKGQEIRDKTGETVENAREQVETRLSDTRQLAEKIVHRTEEQVGVQSHPS